MKIYELGITLEEGKKREFVKIFTDCSIDFKINNEIFETIVTRKNIDSRNLIPECITDIPLQGNLFEKLGLNLKIGNVYSQEELVLPLYNILTQISAEDSDISVVENETVFTVTYNDNTVVSVADL